MGCDIHMYREKRVNGKWETADCWESKYDIIDVAFEERFHDRNYELFSVLAGVRRREEPAFGFTPRGLPVTCCAEVADAANGWGDDGHSHSYLYLHELEDLLALLSSATQPISGMKDRDELAKLQSSIESGFPDWNLLYPYCQGTNDSRSVEFCVNVPALFLLGDGLARIIASIKEIGGDQQRVVFWFDN